MGVKYDLAEFLKAFMKFTQEHKLLPLDLKRINTE